MRLRTVLGIAVLNLALTVSGLLPASAKAQAPAPAAAPGPAPTCFVVRFKIKPGKNAEFEKLIAKVQASLPSSEPGNIYYDLYQPTGEPQTYVIIEHYRNAQAVTAHGQDQAVKDMFTGLKDVLDGPQQQAIQADRLVLVSSKP